MSFNCYTCAGRQLLVCDECDGNGQFVIDCDICQGDKELGNAECDDCEGRGYQSPTCDSGCQLANIKLFKGELICSSCKGKVKNCKVCDKTGLKCDACNNQGQITKTCPQCQSGYAKCQDCPSKSPDPLVLKFLKIKRKSKGIKSKQKKKSGTTIKSKSKEPKKIDITETKLAASLNIEMKNTDSKKSTKVDEVGVEIKPIATTYIDIDGTYIEKKTYTDEHAKLLKKQMSECINKELGLNKKLNTKGINVASLIKGVDLDDYFKFSMESKVLNMIKSEQWALSKTPDIKQPIEYKDFDPNKLSFDDVSVMPGTKGGMHVTYKYDGDPLFIKFMKPF
jgi:hypothetical protein